MASKTKPGAEPAPRTAARSVTELIGDWVQQATEGFIATEKILLDLAAQQNALALTIVRERIGLFSPTPSKAAVDLSGRGTHNFFEAQRLLLEMLAKQNRIVAEGLKPALEGTVADGLADVVHRGLDNFLMAQKQFMDIFEGEAEGAIKDFGDSKSFDSGRASTVAREGMRNFLDSQKRFLDIVEEELLSGPEEAAPGEGERKRTDLFEVAKHSVEAFVETQKRMLDLANDQIDVNVKLVREVLSPDTGKPSTTLPDLVKKSVDSFVAAQKALVELASKPRKPVESAVEPEPQAVGARA